MSEPASTGAIILAAGQSRWSGRPKPLLRYRGRTLLRQAAETALASQCRPVIIVLGSNSHLLDRVVADLPVTLVWNRTWSAGMASSIRTGIAALRDISEESEAAVLLLCDQPLPSPRRLDDLIEVFKRTRPLAVATQCHGSYGVPALFSRDLFDELMSLRGLEGAKQILWRYRDSCLGINLPEDAIDIGPPDDRYRPARYPEIQPR